MKIRLADFKEGSLTQVETRYDPKAIDLEWVDLKYAEPLCLHGTVEKGHDTLIFRGNMISEVEHICARCLKAVKDELNQPFDLLYDIKGKDEIETLDDLREILLLDHPLSYLCREDCRGLCPHCGINLNESRCPCESQTHAQPLTSLKKIWKKTQEES